MTTLTLYTTASDLYGNSNSVYRDTYSYLMLGRNSSGYTFKAWLPFTAAIDQGTSITSATLKLRCQTASSGTTCKFKIGCDDQDNPSKPATWAALDARVQTTAVLTVASEPAWTLGTEYTYDITSAVQEIIDRAGFASGNTIAVLIVDNGSNIGAERQAAAYEDATYTEAILEIVYSGAPPATFAPKIISF